MPRTCAEGRDVHQTGEGTAYIVWSHDDDLSECPHHIAGLPNADKTATRWLVALNAS